MVYFNRKMCTTIPSVELPLLALNHSLFNKCVRFLNGNESENFIEVHVLCIPLSLKDGYHLEGCVYFQISSL